MSTKKLAIGATVPVEDTEQTVGVTAPESEQLAIGTSIPISEANNDTNVVYLEDRDEMYNYPASQDEDATNYDLQTQVYGKDKNSFILGVEEKVNKGVDILAGLGKGFMAFFPSAALGTLGGTTMMTGELAEEGMDQEGEMFAKAGIPSKAIFDTVLSLVAKNTDVDEHIAEAGKEIINKASEMLNNSFFKPGESTAEQVAFDIGGAGASLFTALGISVLTKSPAAASALFGQIAASDTYVRGREEGKSPRESYQAALLNFTTEFGLEYLGIEAFTKYLKGSRTISRIFAKASTEFFQEAGQTLGSELSAKALGFGEEDFGKIIQDMLYSGAIGFVTGGMGGAVQVIRENKGLIGEWREAGFTDAELEIVFPVLQKAYNQEFKAAVVNAAQREIDRMVAEAGQEGKPRVVVDEDGNPVTLGMDELEDEDKFKYKDREVSDVESAEKYEAERLAEKPTTTEQPGATIIDSADPAVQGRINQIEAELKPLYKEAADLLNKIEDGTATKGDVKRYQKIQKEVSRREIERDEVGFEWVEGTLGEAPVEGGKTVRMTAAQATRLKINNAKNQIRQFKAGFRAGKVATQEDIKAFQDTLIEMINMSDVLTDKQKLRMANTVKSTQTEKNMQKRVAQLEIRIKQFEVANSKKVYAKAVQRLLKKAKTKKFDANTRALFDELLKLNEEQGLDVDTFQAAYDGTIESVLRYDIALLNSIDPSLAELRRVFQDLKMVFEQGVDSLKLEKQQKKEELEKNLETVNKEIAGKDKRVKSDPNAQERKKSRRRVWPIGMFTFESIINRITRGTGKKEGQTWMERRFNTTRAFLLADRMRFLFNKRATQAYQEAFGLADNSAALRKQQADMTDMFTFSWEVGAKEEIIDEETGEVIQEAVEGEWKSIELTKSQMRKRIMEWQRGVGRKTLERKNQYTDELIADIEANLTEGDYAFMRAQFQIYDQLYAIAAPIYRKHKGVELPYDDFYTHLFTIGGVEMDITGIDTMAGQSGQSFFGNNITNKDIFKRATGSSAGLKPIDDIFALDKYIQDMSHFIGYADLVTDIESLLLSPDTMANIEANWGSAVKKFLRHEFNRMRKSQMETNMNPAWQWVTNFSRPLARTYLAKPIIGIKQLVSLWAYMAEVPHQHFLRYLSDFANPANAEVMDVINKFRSDIMIQSRGNVFEREVKASREAIRNSTDVLGKDGKMKASQILLGAMRLGDRGAIYVGAYAMYRYDTEVKKIGHEEAMNHFRDFTNKTQQSPDPFQLSPALADPNPITRLLTIFTQAKVQYFNSMARAIWNAPTVSPTETARKIFVYHALLPMLWQFVANGFQWDTEDELKAGILGPLAYIHITGELLSKLVSWGVALTMDSQDTQWRSDMNMIETHAKTVTDVVKKVHELIAEGGLDEDDTFKLLQDLAIASGPVTGAIGGAAQYAVGVGKGIVKTMEGEYVDALQKFLGYSDYVIEKDEE